MKLNYSTFPFKLFFIYSLPIRNLLIRALAEKPGTYVLP